MDEGHSAIVHATALALPGSRLVVAGDATPKRLHIELAPPPMGSGRGLLYTCKTCEGGPAVPDPVSINVTSCLFHKHTGYGYAPTLEAARKVHPCRYFDVAHLAAVCALLGDANVRTGAYGWFCGEVEAQASKIGLAPAP